MLLEEPGGHVPFQGLTSQESEFSQRLFHPTRTTVTWGCMLKTGFWAPSQTSSRRPWNRSSRHQVSDSWGHQSSRNTSSAPALTGPDQTPNILTVTQASPLRHQVGLEVGLRPHSPGLSATSAR